MGCCMLLGNIISVFYIVPISQYVNSIPFRLRRGKMVTNYNRMGINRASKHSFNIQNTTGGGWLICLAFRILKLEKDQDSENQIRIERRQQPVRHG